MTKLRGGLIQMGLKASTDEDPETIRTAMLDAHLPVIDEAGEKGVQVLCFQEVFTQPYFCPSQDKKWYAAAESIPDGPTTALMQEYAAKHEMVIVVPIYEESEVAGLYYNTAAVIDADGSYLGKYRKTHIPQVAGFWEKFFFTPGNSGGRWRWAGRSISSIPRPPWRGYRNISGSSSSRPRPSPMAASSAPSTASAESRPGISASFTARAIS